MSTPHPSPVYRLPNPEEIDRSLRGTDEEKKIAMRKLKKAIAKAWDTLSLEQKSKVEGAFTGLIQSTTVTAFLAANKPATGYVYDERKLLINLIDAINKHGHAGLTIHPAYATERPLTLEESKILDAVVDRLETIVKEIKAGAHDKRLENVFGPTKIDDARPRFDAGLEALKELRDGKHVTIDMVNKAAVWKCVGLTGARSIDGKTPGHMKLANGKLDKVTDDLITTVAHEMTHAIPERATGDRFYRHHEGFKTAGEEIKLITAAYYEEVIEQILMNKDVPPFIPVDDSSKDTTVEKVLETYRARACEIVNAAWATAINIYNKLQEPGEWAEPQDKAKKTFRWAPETLTLLKNASKLLGLTIHRRPTLLADNSNPVSQLDLSLLDNKLSMLGKLNGCIKDVLVLPVDVKVYDKKLEDFVLRHALLKVNGNRDVPGVLCKNVDKDVIVIRSLANLYDGPDWKTLEPNLIAGLPEPMRTAVARGDGLYTL